MSASLHTRHKTAAGFTLVEMSIVLVIIGLLVGSIMAGQTLIAAAAVSGQISQIDKYQTATHLFESKYNYLPGDIPEPYASGNNFQHRGSNAGEGDGNGLLEGNCADSPTGNSGFQIGCGEPAVFWQDLSTVGLIDTGVKTGTNYPSTTTPAAWPNTTATSTPAIKDWLPVAKLGNGNYVYAYSWGAHNYFAVSTVTKIGWSVETTMNPGITVQQAYNIDSKIDDGLPQSGKVSACYINYDALPDGGEVSVYAANALHEGTNNGITWFNNNGSACNPTPAATSPQSYNCFDNGGSTGTQQYATQYNADLQNCALSFEFQ